MGFNLNFGRYLWLYGAQNEFQCPIKMDKLNRTSHEILAENPESVDVMHN
jgi:hypothetical protein